MQPYISCIGSRVALHAMIEPIQCTSLSLIQATQAITSVSPDDQRLLYSAVLWLWHDKLKEEVIAASEALRKKGEANSG